MKKILSALTVCLLACGLFSTKAQSTASRDGDDVVSGSDSTAVDVIAYFAKGDTCDYWMTDSKWDIIGTDTTQTAGITTLVRLVVTDSTSAGYKMTYTFMDMQVDTTVGGVQNLLLDRITGIVRDKVVGTSVEFETDEFGSILRFTNLDQISKSAKSIFKESMKELKAVPEVKALKKMGFNLNGIARAVDTDDLVEGYVEELKLMFLCHGNSYGIGHVEEHEDASDGGYEADTYTTVSVDEDGSYAVDVEVVNVVPQEDFMALLNVFAAGLLKDAGVAEEIGKAFDGYVKEDGTLTDRICIKCFDDGWPSEVVKQKFVKFGPIEKVSQTFIGAYRFAQRQ